MLSKEEKEEFLKQIKDELKGEILGSQPIGIHQSSVKNAFVNMQFDTKEIEEALKGVMDARINFELAIGKLDDAVRGCVNVSITM